MRQSLGQSCYHFDFFTLNLHFLETNEIIIFFLKQRNEISFQGANYKASNHKWHAGNKNEKVLENGCSTRTSQAGGHKLLPLQYTSQGHSSQGHFTVNQPMTARRTGFAQLALLRIFKFFSI